MLGLRYAAVLLTIAACAVAHLDAECVRLKSAREQKKYTTHLFSGRVTAVDASEDTVRFEVTRVWKGPVGPEFFTFVIPGEDNLPAKFFKEGQSYLVFANVSQTVSASVATLSVPAGTLAAEISECSGTGPIEDARDWMKSLGAGKPPGRVTRFR